MSEELANSRRLFARNGWPLIDVTRRSIEETRRPSLAICRIAAPEHRRDMSLWRAGDPLLLASRSLARLAVLRGAGLPVEARAVDLDERAIEQEAAPPAPRPMMWPACWRGKGARRLRSCPRRLVLGADQTLAIAGEILHKPADLTEARAQLRRLSGHTHVLHSAVAVVRGEEVLFEIVESARLTMRDLSDACLDSYLAEAGTLVLTSVGAYQIEGPGVHLFERIDGNHFTILGLPLLPGAGLFPQ